MRLFFGGGEIPGWRDLLHREGVRDVSLSFVGLHRRTRNGAKNYSIAENFQGDANVFLDSGAYSFNKKDSEHTREEAQMLAEAYKDFVEANIDRVEIASEFDAVQFGLGAIEHNRENFYDLLGDKFMPIWHPEYGMDELERLASAYRRVGITETEVEGRDITPVLNNLVGRYGVLLHGVAITGMGSMGRIKWDSVGSTSWLSPSQYGDTFVWTGSELKRYPMKYKDQARRRHRTLFEANGFDAQLIADDNRDEILRLSIWSWTQFLADINRHRAFQGPGATQQPEFPDDGNGEDDDGVVVHLPTQPGNAQLVTPAPQPRELVDIPLLSTTWKTTEHEDGSTTSTPMFGVRDESMRMCDTCFLKGKCPAFTPGASCAYKIPVEVKTAEQLRALQEGLIEMQAQRVTFAAMTEQIEGGYPDPNLSGEIDRLGRLIKQKQDSEKEIFRATQDVTMAGGPGFISKMFGQAAGDKLHDQTAPPREGEKITNIIGEIVRDE